MSDWYRKRFFRYAIGLVLGSLSFIGGYWFSGYFWDAGIFFTAISATVIAILHPAFKEYQLRDKGQFKDFEYFAILILCVTSITTLAHNIRFEVGHPTSVVPVILATFIWGIYVGARAFDSQSSKTSPAEDQPESSEPNTAD